MRSLRRELQIFLKELMAKKITPNFMQREEGFLIKLS
jgi:hypothetical protein